MKSKRSTSRCLQQLCSALVPRQGYGVEIRRADGTTFLSTAGHGVVPAIWNLSNRRYAAIHKNEMRDEGFDARLVRVIFADPIVQNSDSTTKVGY